MTFTIELPIPDARLSPNARQHWATKARLTKLTRQAAMFAALSATKSTRPMLTHNVTEQTTVYVRDKRRRDADNMLGRMKGIWDGFTDAALWPDDHVLTHLPLVFVVDRLNPRMVITVSGEPCEPDKPHDLFSA